MFILYLTNNLEYDIIIYMKNTKSKYFSLGEYYKGKCGTVGLVVKDVIIGKENTLENASAILFITLTYNGKLIEAQIPLEDTPDFKRHILAIVDQASKLKPKKVKEDGKK